MARKSITPEILQVLEPYLDRKDNEWWNQTGERKPTLPTTSDNKVNVRQLVQEIGRKPSDVQHFFNKNELYDPINVLATVQSIGPIGSRVISKNDDDIARNELSRAKSTSKAEHEAYVEAVAEISRLRKENEQLRAMKNYFQETGCVLRQTEIKY